MIYVDIIFITYNQEQYVAQGIESILNQIVSDNVNVRVIVADDCSTDKTLSIIKSYERKSPFSFVYTNYVHNVGMHNNYKHSFELCEGNYIAILEGDDWWHRNNHIQQHVDFLEAHHNFSMSFNQIRFLDASSDEFFTQWSLPQNFDFFPVFLKDLIVKGNQIGNLSACVFRDRLLKTIPNKLFESNFADWDLGMWMAQFGPIGFLRGDSSTYRVDYNGQWTKLDDNKKRESMIKTFHVMDGILKHRYHRWFEEGIYNVENGISPSLYISWKTKVKRFLHVN